MGRSQSVEIGGTSVTFCTEQLPEWFVDVIREQERESLESLLDTIRPDDVLYDIGANFGLYSFFAADQIEDGTIVAVEPYPPNVERIRATARLNETTNLRVCDIALGDADESRPFEPTSSKNYATATFRNPEEGSAVDTVDTRRGDSLVADGELPPPTVVKIDVEGSEPEVLGGMSETLERPDCRYLLCELHPPDPEAAHRRSLADYDTSVTELVARIESLGFDTTLWEREEQIHVVAVK